MGLAVRDNCLVQNVAVQTAQKLSFGDKSSLYDWVIIDVSRELGNFGWVEFNHHGSFLDRADKLHDLKVVQAMDLLKTWVLQDP